MRNGRSGTGDSVMKCIVLAGGTGDALWPLSRQKYPKQFMPFRENRSLFQENIVRNMTFCDEFIIVTNKDFKFIVESQMRALQGVHYRIIVEECSKKTAIPVTAAAMACGEKEDILVISSDALIEGYEYQNDMIESKKLVEAGKIVLHGIKPARARSRFAYVIGSGEYVTKFVYRPDEETASGLMNMENCYWNTGIIMCNAGVLLEDIRIVSSRLYQVCKDIFEKFDLEDMVISEKDVRNEEALSIDEAYLCKSRKLYLLACSYSWKDIGSFRVYEKYIQVNDKDNVLKNNSNATVINRAGNRLVVVNGINDAVVVNTEDAVYVTDRESSDEIKSIIRDNHERYVDYFDYNTVSFRSWGKHELLKKGDGYKVKKVTVSPGMEFSLHKHEYRSEQWTVVKGTPTITLGEKNGQLVTKDYQMGSCIFVPIGTPHKVRNNTLEDVEIVEVAVGHRVQDSDVIRLGKQVTEKEHFIKLSPAFKDYLWGGTRIRDELGKKCDLDVIAESWELSAHADGVSRVACGKYEGMYFNDYLEAIGREALGWKCQHYDRFPILIKFIDAANPLSIQIHPDDEYALKNEGEYGKNEMWYVMDCDEGAYIYYGTKGVVSKEELRERIKNNTILEVLNKVYVHKGDVFYVQTGTIHAICGGILICEIQQSSNSTYRMYDYDRRDKFGKPRQLHIDKAIDVVRTDEISELKYGLPEQDSFGNEKTMLVQCKYFECNKYVVKNELKLPMDETSFRSIMVVDGSGEISDGEYSMKFVRGDSFFVPAYKNIIQIAGQCEIIVTHI